MVGTVAGSKFKSMLQQQDCLRVRKRPKTADNSPEADDEILDFISAVFVHDSQRSTGAKKEYRFDADRRLPGDQTESCWLFVSGHQCEVHWSVTVSGTLSRSVRLIDLLNENMPKK